LLNFANLVVIVANSMNKVVISNLTSKNVAKRNKKAVVVANVQNVLLETIVLVANVHKNKFVMKKKNVLLLLAASALNVHKLVKKRIANVVSAQNVLLEKVVFVVVVNNT